jgi:hypothetical protein
MVDPKQIDVEFKDDGMQEVPPDDEMLQAGLKYLPDSFYIPRSEWDDRIREHEKNKSSADFYAGGRFTHQGNSSECVAHAAQIIFMTAYNRQFNGLSHNVWFSPLALYVRICGSRYGGSNVRDSCREMIARGMLPCHDGPGGDNAQTKIFEHTLHQTSGRTENHWPTKGWLRESGLPNGWENTAKQFRALEVYLIPREVEAHASVLLHGMGCSNGRQGHSVPHLRLIKENGRYLSAYRDSYNVTRYDSERWMDSGGFCIRSTTTPDIEE